MSGYEHLEDEFGDVVGKARRGQELTIADLASATGLSASDCERIEAYEWTPGNDGVNEVARALSLHPEKLRRSAAAAFFPVRPSGGQAASLDVRMLILGDDFLMNGYVVTCRQTGETAIVDPGFQAPRLLAAAAEAGKRVSRILLTHGHGDHVGAVAEVNEATGARAFLCEADLALAGDAAAHIGGRLRPGTSVELGAQSFRVVATPGHTPGGVSLLHDEIAFVGDALFAGSLGGTRRRADYEGQRRAVAEHLLSLPPETTLYPGHGPATTVGEERQNNPYFD